MGGGGMGGMGSLFGNGGGRAKAVDEGKVKTRFSDVAGVEEVKEESEDLSSKTLTERIEVNESNIKKGVKKLEELQVTLENEPDQKVFAKIIKENNLKLPE